jgi:hypothetical protein
LHLRFAHIANSTFVCCVQELWKSTLNVAKRKVCDDIHLLRQFEQDAVDVHVTFFFDALQQKKAI